MKFQNRLAAGTLLADQLKKYTNQKDVLILALPRGGAIVADPVAEKLKCPMDLCLVKKIGVPFHEELAMGAIAINTKPIFNEELLNQSGISKEELNEIISEKENELRQRNKKYRKNKPAPDVKNKIVIIVDDGIATGATMHAAINAIKAQGTKKIIIAIPVADKGICDEMKKLVDDVICLYQPPDLMSVGDWYVDFEQVADEEVVYCLDKHQ